MPPFVPTHFENSTAPRRTPTPESDCRGRSTIPVGVAKAAIRFRCGPLNRASLLKRDSQDPQELFLELLPIARRRRRDIHDRMHDRRATEDAERKIGA